MDDIDFSLILHKHGWTTFLFHVDKKPYELFISGVFSDPFYDLTNLLLSLLNDTDDVTIKLFGEPGGYLIDVKRNKVQRHVMAVEIGLFSAIEDDEVFEYEKLVSFEIKLKQFLIIAFYQLKKTYLLFKDKSFATGRKEDFPYDLYNKLTEKIAVDLKEIL